jgi:glycosyltransferase involved in cell wall biosynthesis
VLIIDDASPDNTAEVGIALSKMDPRVTFLRHETNKQHIATYNEGIEWVSAEYMLLLSADDYLLPGALDRAIRVLQSHPDVGFVYGKVIRSAESGIIGSSNDPTEPCWSVVSGHDFIKMIEVSGCVNFVPTPTAVVRTTLQKRLGGYCADLPHAGDLEMWLRFAAHASVARLNTYQAVYRHHGANMYLNYFQAERQLPDLQQREAALRYFCDTCASQLSDPHRVLRDLLRPLSFEAVGCASAAFNEGEMRFSENLAAFASRINPQIRRSRKWLYLGIKRRLGPNLWRALRMFAGRNRREKPPLEAA